MRTAPDSPTSKDKRQEGLYTPEQRARRDRSRWTLVQGILAPVQFLIFAVSLVLIVRYLITGQGLEAANWSVVAKTFALYAIMYTGALWEHDVYGQYLFAPAFYWEDMVSMAVIALHTLYLVSLVFGLFTANERLFVALAAYTTYAVNATQFVLKLRAARLQETRKSASLTGVVA
ncbi:MAG: 2-vinyl bacteriochlorophyllide hydratase [Gemmatimonadaceae bacterium]